VIWEHGQGGDWVPESRLSALCNGRLGLDLLECLG
jgi:hypothetical protein